MWCALGAQCSYTLCGPFFGLGRLSSIGSASLHFPRFSSSCGRSGAPCSIRRCSTLLGMGLTDEASSVARHPSGLLRGLFLSRVLQANFIHHQPIMQKTYVGEALSHTHYVSGSRSDELYAPALPALLATSPSPFILLVHAYKKCTTPLDSDLAYSLVLAN